MISSKHRKIEKIKLGVIRHIGANGAECESSGNTTATRKLGGELSGFETGRANFDEQRKVQCTLSLWTLPLLRDSFIQYFALLVNISTDKFLGPSVRIGKRIETYHMASIARRKARRA